MKKNERFFLDSLRGFANETFLYATNEEEIAKKLLRLESIEEVDEEKAKELLTLENEDFIPETGVDMSLLKYGWDEFKYAMFHVANLQEEVGKLD